MQILTTTTITTWPGRSVNEKVSFTVTLKDGDKGLDNKPVWVVFSCPEPSNLLHYQDVGDYYTDENGSFFTDAVVFPEPGWYRVHAQFAGDDQYELQETFTDVNVQPS
jgi:hypothetical protein